MSGENSLNATRLGMNLELFILAGGTHPVILSPVPGKASTYKVISEAFVPQIMHGEVVYGKHPIAPTDPHDYLASQGGPGKDVHCHSSAKEQRVPPSWKQIYLA